VAERGGRGRADQLEAPFVGRDMELRLLKDLFHGTGAERRLRHVSVVGTAGIGKSRLGWELEKYLDGISETVLWHHGRSPAYGQGITFWSLGEMVRGRAGLAETDDEATTRAKVSAMLDGVMPGHADRRWVESAMLELLGVSTGFPSGELFGAWRAFFEALARTGTVLLVFQDVHWADTGTLDFIDHLVEWARESPIFILTLARPEILEARPEWGSARRGFTSVYLEPLGEAAMRQLLAGLVPGLPEAAANEIVRQSEGVPLYAVETVRMMVTAGQLKLEEDGRYAVAGDVSKLAVPETLTALIAARLDALEAADRTLLLDAAVLGQSFTPAGLAAITGRTVDELIPRLRGLVRRELFREVADPRSPERGQYAFVQALVREVAYNTLAKRDRQSRHLAAARWFESLGEPELVGALAGHYLAARSLAAPGAEADALAAQARIALKAAGERAAALGSHKQAVAFWEQALSVTTDDRDAAELHERAGDSLVVTASFDAGEAHFTKALDLQRNIGDRPAVARVTASYGTMLLSARRFEQGNKLLADAATELADLGDDPSLLRIRSQQARGHGFANESDAALQVSDEVLAQAEKSDALAVIADTLITRGTVLATLLRWREGLAILDLAREIAEQNGLSNTTLRSINNALSTRLLLDPKASFEAIADAMALARRLGESGWLASFPGVYGFAALRTGDWDLGVAELERGLAEIQDPRTRGILVNNLANLRACRGEPTDELMAELEALVALGKTVQTESYLLESKGWVELCGGHLDAATRTWQKLVDIDPYQSNTTWVWLGKIAIWRGDVDRAAEVAERLWQYVPHGGASELDHGVLVAAIKGLRGDRVGSANEYRAVIEGYRGLRLPLDEALLAIDMAYVLGSTDTLSLETAARARVLFNQIRAKPFLDFLDGAVEHDAHQPGTGGAAPKRAARGAARSPASG
jgi:tetratricopeptide (TPR) repeat protein